MKALIYQGSVVQISQEEFEVNPAYTWVDCDVNVQVGWTYVEGEFVPPPEPPTPTNAEMRIALLPTDSIRVEALWEAVVRNNTTPANDLEVEIQNIYTQYPV